MADGHADRELIAVFSGDRDGYVCPYGKVRLTCSTDGGRTWIAADYTNLDGFPQHVIRLKDGRLLCSYASRTIGRCGIYAAHGIMEWSVSSGT